jgi:peptide/nickel transport system substrate-binding protein
MNKLRKPLLVAASAVAAAALTGCGGGAKPAPQAAAPPPGSSDINVQPRSAIKPGGSLRLSIQQYITQFNVGQIDGTQGDGASIVAMVEPQLWLLDDNAVPSVNPDVLASAQVTATSPAQVVTYRLNPKATWSDGTAITWQDFATQWRTRNGSDKAYEVAGTTGYDLISDVSQGAGPAEVKVTFSKPYADWRSLFDPLLPGSTLDTPDKFNKGWIGKVPVVGGPWKIGSMDQTAQTITVVPNEKYWGQKPLLDSVVYRALDSSAITDAYLNNEIDEAPGRDPDAYKRLSGMANSVIRSGGRWDETHLSLSSRGALADVKVREAISCAINRPAIAAAQSAGLPFKVNVLDNHFYMPSQQGYSDNSGAFGKFDVAHAKALLDQAGWTAPNGGTGTRTKGGQPLKLTYVVNAASTSTVPQLIQNMLAQVGIDVELTKVPQNDFFEKYVNVGAFDLVSFRNVDEVYSTLLLPTFLTTGDQNFGKVGTPQIDQLLDQAAQEPDQKKSIALYNQADAQIWAAGHSVELFQTPQILAVRKGLANFGAFGLRGDHQLTDTGFVN